MGGDAAKTELFQQGGCYPVEVVFDEGGVDQNLQVTMF